MIVSVGVEIFMLFTCSEKVHFFLPKFHFYKKPVHGHGQDRCWVKRFAVSNFDFL